MAQIRPFTGVHFSRERDADLSKLIAPPYDVLDEADRKALQAAHPHNIVNIDLPHLPAKSAGPDEVYERANLTLQAWLKAGILKRDSRGALYPYAQSFKHGERTFHRRGFIALVRLSPFGAGHVVPHEKTYKGPIEDRLKLMRATGMQLSPIFGLFSDPRNEVTNLLYHNLGKPEYTGTHNGVKNDMWSVTDGETENRVIDLMGTKPVYIADGHHRYTTALQFQKEAEAQAGGPLPAHHPANFCMFVLVGMQDDGLLILPTHRLIGGLDSFDIDTFSKLVAADFEISEMAVWADRLPDAVHSLAADAPNTFGLFDGKTRKLYTLRLKNPNLLARFEPGQSGVAQPGRGDPATLSARRNSPAEICRRQGIDQRIHRRSLRDRAAGGRDALPDRHSSKTNSPPCSGRTRQARRSHAAKEHVFLPEARNGNGDVPANTAVAANSKFQAPKPK